MNILQLAKIDKDRRLTLHKSTLEAAAVEKGDEFVIIENHGKLTLTPAGEVENLIEG